MKSKLDKAKDVAAILQEQFLDLDIVVINSLEDLEKLEKKRKEEIAAEDFWSQDFKDLL